MLTGLTVLFECCILAFLQSIGVQSRPVVLIMPMIFLVSLAYFFEVGRSWRLKPVAFQLAIAYCMRVFLVLLDIYGRSYVSLPNSGADSEMFYSQAIRYSLGDKGYGAFTDITGMVFSWIGVSRLYMQFLLMLCSILALHTLVRIMQQTDVEAVVQSRVMWVLCLIPNFAILSSVFLRESIVVLLVTLSLYFFDGRKGIMWGQGRIEAQRKGALYPARQENCDGFSRPLFFPKSHRSGGETAHGSDVD